MKTEICERLGIEFPIFAFSHCRDVVAAVSRAGGLGVLGAVAYSPEQLELELKWIDEHVDGKPYGVDTVIPAQYLGKDDGDMHQGGQLDQHGSRLSTASGSTALLEIAMVCRRFRRWGRRDREVCSGGRCIGGARARRGRDAAPDQADRECARTAA